MPLQAGESAVLRGGAAMTDEISHLMLSLLLEHSRDAALVIDQNGVIRYAGPALRHLSGYKSADLIGHKLGLLLPEPDDQAVLDYFRQASGATALGRSREISLRDAAGHVIPVDLKPVDLGEEQELRLFGAFLTDLRARKALEAENQALHARLEHEALTDGQTGLPNRRAFDAEAIRAMARAQRDESRTLFALMEIDDFKAITAQFGPSGHDAVLKTFARSVLAAMRATDFFARIDGAEFGWLLPRITIEQAVPAVNRIRQAVAATEMSLAGRPGITVTISAGLTLLDPAQPLSASFERAAAALHAAKEQGRNRLIVR
jgi:diguanylate cyclase (GGDEF)-like protein/PAS domain S-box-containing protein